MALSSMARARLRSISARSLWRSAMLSVRARANTRMTAMETRMIIRFRSRTQSAMAVCRSSVSAIMTSPYRLALATPIVGARISFGGTMNAMPLVWIRLMAAR